MASPGAGLSDATAVQIRINGADLARTAVDPLPQAMVLTSIVIGLGLTALMVAMAIRLYEKYRTFDMQDIRRLKG